MLVKGDRVQIQKAGSDHNGYHATVEEQKNNGFWLVNIDGVGYRQYKDSNLILLSNLSRAKAQFGLVKPQVVDNEAIVKDIKRRLKAISEEQLTILKLLAQIS